MFNDSQLCSQNSPTIVADTSNSCWSKFVKLIYNHSIFNFQVVQCFKWFIAFKWICVFKWFSSSSGSVILSGSVIQCSKLVGFKVYIYFYWSAFSCMIGKLLSLPKPYPVQICISMSSMHLYLKIIWKTYQFIHCFNSSF